MVRTAARLPYPLMTERELVETVVELTAAEIRCVQMGIAGVPAEDHEFLQNAHAILGGWKRRAQGELHRRFTTALHLH